MKLYVIRHGETDVNLNNKINSLNDDDLNENGIAEAKKLAANIKSIDYDLIISSPLIRAKHTADIINYKKIPIDIEKKVIERDLGKYTKMPIESVDSEKMWSLKYDGVYETVESMKDFINRVYKFLEKLKQRYSNKTVILVTHGGVSKAISSYFYGFNENESIYEYKQKNCEIHEFDI